MSKKCPYIKTTKKEGWSDSNIAITITEVFGDCAESDCPYYTQDTDAPSFCIRAQRPEDVSETTRSIGFNVIRTFLPNDK